MSMMECFDVDRFDPGRFVQTFGFHWNESYCMGCQVWNVSILDSSIRRKKFFPHLKPSTMSCLRNNRWNGNKPCLVFKTWQWHFIDVCTNNNKKNYNFGLYSKFTTTNIRNFIYFVYIFCLTKINCWSIKKPSPYKSVVKIEAGLHRSM